MNEGPPVDPPHGRQRWWLAGLAFGLALAYLAVATALGLELKIGGRDVTLAFALVIELAFGALGYVLGSALEARRWERRVAEAMRRQMEELASVQRRLARTEQLASLGQLASAVAHEVRNPLAIVRSSLQNLAEQADTPATARRTCRDLIEEIDRLSRVTSSVLELARPLPLRWATVPAAEIVARTDLLARQLLGERAIRLEVAGGAGARVCADPDLICQVLLGLLANAAAVTPAGGSITLEWGERGSEVEFAVADRGPGVPEALRQRIFEPFFTTRADGNGLGLAVARQIAEAHGGRLEVTSHEGSGARFSLRLAEAAPAGAAA